MKEIRKLLFIFMYVFLKKKIFGSFGCLQSLKRPGKKGNLSDHLPNSWPFETSLLTSRSYWVNILLNTRGRNWRSADFGGLVLQEAWLTTLAVAFLPCPGVAMPRCSQQRALSLHRIRLTSWGGENFQRYNKYLDPIRNMHDFPWNINVKNPLLLRTCGCLFD